MAKAAKKKAKTSKKAARMTAKSKTAKSAKAAKAAKKKAAKPSRPAARKTAKKKIDPLNRTQYRSVTPMLAVRDVRRAVDFYVSAFGFKPRAIMDGPDGKAFHAELNLRDTTLMLSPEEPTQGSFSANSLGNTPATLYVLVDNVDKTFAAAVAAGAQVGMPVMDMFWGDRCGVVKDLDGNKWMIATHTSEPTPAQMQAAMQQMQQQSQSAPESAAAAAAAGSESEY